MLRGSEVSGLLSTRYAPLRYDYFSSCANANIQGILQLHFQFKRVCFLPLYSLFSVLTIPRFITASDFRRQQHFVINCDYVRSSIIITKQKVERMESVGVWIIAFIWI